MNPAILGCLIDCKGRAWEIETHVTVASESPTKRLRLRKFQFIDSGELTGDQRSKSSFRRKKKDQNAKYDVRELKTCFLIDLRPIEITSMPRSLSNASMLIFRASSKFLVRKLNSAKLIDWV